ncbi:MAG: hypothetical protein ACRDS1_04915 [Pseudonocardiaceae bacterium]
MRSRVAERLDRLPMLTARRAGRLLGQQLDELRGRPELRLKGQPPDGAPGLGC